MEKQYIVATVIITISILLFMMSGAQSETKSETFSNDLIVSYNKKDVKDGSRVSLEKLEHRPYIEYPFKSGALYTIIFLAKHGTLYNWLLWLVVNAPESNVSRGREVSSYQQPLGYRHHKYSFYVYEQKGIISPKRPTNRQDWNIRGFIKKYKLKPVSSLTFEV